MLARGAQRRGEFAMRAALGAARARLIRQSLTESGLLALLGGVLGVGVAEIGVRILIALSPPGLPRANAIELDAPVLLFAFGLTAIVGLAAGVLPAMQTPRSEVQSELRQSSQTSSTQRQRVRRGLVVGEVAVALLLMVCAGLLLRSMGRLLSIDPGFSTEHVLTMQVKTAGHRFDDLATAPGAGDRMRHQFFEQALQAVREVPGVSVAGFTSVLPLSDDPGWVSTYGAHFENDDPKSGRNVFRYAITPGYCQAMGISLLGGRFLDEHDRAEAPPVALISESL